MDPDLSEIKAAIRREIQRLAANLGADASAVADDEIIPASGILDSAALIDLIVWYEQYFKLSIPQSDINIDDFGSIELMAEYANSKLSQ
jgi:D-alanine--poly(phosphoribitol) ligase subunit 2